MKHTLQRLQWINYPSLDKKDCEVLVYRFGKMVEITLLPGQQEGFWVCGYELAVRSRTETLLYRKMSPCRKWGEYPTRERAILDTLQLMATTLYVYRLQPQSDERSLADSMKRLNDTIRVMKGIQLTMFI